MCYLLCLSTAPSSPISKDIHVFLFAMQGVASIYVAYMSTGSCRLWEVSDAPVLRLARVGQLCQFLDSLLC